MEVETETPQPGDLVAVLEQATLMAKQLPTTADPVQLHQIKTYLHSAHHHLSLFLSHHHPPPPQPTQPPAISFSSAIGGAGDNNYEIGGGEPMQLGDDEEEEQNSKFATTTTAAVNVNKVEERMRECFIQNKRPKRPLSPSSVVAEQRLRCENEAVRDGSVTAELDSVGTRSRSLELIYQFHA